MSAQIRDMEGKLLDVVFGMSLNVQLGAPIQVKGKPYTVRLAAKGSQGKLIINVEPVEDSTNIGLSS